jgi:small redox-active disulfide protein 2
MTIKVLGTGCANCKNLEKVAQIAVSEMGITAEIIKEEDIQKIMSYGIMRTPALVIDEKVALYGRVPSVKN